MELLRRGRKILRSTINEHVALVNKTRRLRTHCLRQVFWIQVASQVQLSRSGALLHFRKAEVPSLRALLPMSGAGERLECQTVEFPGVVVVRARGILSYDTATGLEDVLQWAIERGHVVLDLAQVTNIDTSGYGALEQLHQKAHQSGRLLLFAGASRRILRAIEILHIDRDITTFETAEEALVSLKHSAAAPAEIAAGIEERRVRRARPAAAPAGALQPVQGGAQDAVEELRPRGRGPGDAG